MLHAVLNSKASRVSVGGADVAWRDLFRQREDLLTAAFFGRFAYLSPDGQRAVLGVLLGDDAVDGLGNFEGIEFWPRFKRVSASGYVEPDVLVYFSKAVLLVEVKPPAGGNQHVEQWRNELTAVFAEADARESEMRLPGHVVFLALGRIFPWWQEAARQLSEEFTGRSFSIGVQEWTPLARGVATLLKSATGADRAVYGDWLQAFGLYGARLGFPLFGDMLSVVETGFDDWRDLAARGCKVTPPADISASIWPEWQLMSVFLDQHVLEPVYGEGKAAVY